jgi:D-glycero-alpha-D-manno-heptose 1-phosphate guanylyltransferase
MPAGPAIPCSLDAVVLCGGKGARLQSALPDRPKALAPVGERALLDILVEDLVVQGVRRIILCVGYLKEQIIAHFSGRTEASFLFSEETAPLGTGGAVRNAARLIESDPLLIMNGDSLCRFDLQALLAFHQVNSAALTIVVAQDRERHDVGTIRLAQDRRIRVFSEKGNADGGPGYINAGIYLMRRGLIESWRRGDPLSLEYDVLPRLVASERCFGFVVSSQVIDIGTPERYQRAQGGLAF